MSIAVAEKSVADPLLAPPSSMPESPLLRDEAPPLRPSLLDFNPTTRHMENLDALRIVAMASIIISHVLTPYADAAYFRRAPGEPLGLLFLLTYAINVATRFGVPCFMMISFYIYWHQLYDKGRTWGELLKRRFKRLFPAFYCWSMIYLGVHRLGIWLIAHHYVTAPGGATSFSQHFQSIDLGNWRTWFDVLILGKAEYHLYYLSVVMQCLLLIPLLRVLLKKPIVSWSWVILTVLGWTVAMYSLALLPKTATLHKAVNSLIEAEPTFGGSALAEPHPFYKGIFNQETGLPLLVFPLLGMMCAGQKPFRKFMARTSTRFWIGLLALGIALHLLEAFVLLPRNLYVAMTYLKAGRLITGLAIFVLFLRRPLMRDPIPRLSHHAFGMHFMHPMIILALMVAEHKFLGQYLGVYEHFILPTLLVNLVLTFAITFGLCLLISRFKRLEFLVV